MTWIEKSKFFISEMKRRQLFHEAMDRDLQVLGRQKTLLKEEQYEALKAIVVDKKDRLVILPTGFGKSLIYPLSSDRNSSVFYNKLDYFCLLCFVPKQIIRMMRSRYELITAPTQRYTTRFRGVFSKLILILFVMDISRYFLIIAY